MSPITSENTLTEMFHDRLAVERLLREYPLLMDVVSDLSSLARHNPLLVPQILTLGMAFAIYAAERQLGRTHKLHLVESLMDDAVEALWP